MNPSKASQDEASDPTTLHFGPWRSPAATPPDGASQSASLLAPDDGVDPASSAENPSDDLSSGVHSDLSGHSDLDGPSDLSGASLSSASGFHDDGDDERLLRLARDGDRGSFERLFSRYREDLRRVVAWRTDPRLRARVDPSDVVQEAQLEAFRRLDDFLRRRPMGFRLWLRKTAQEQLAKAFRRHVGTQMRAAGRETSLNDSQSPGIGAIAASAETPSQHMAAQEAAQAVWEGLAELAEHDREILIMRNYEGLNYDEICVVLDIEPAAARKRYGRALLRLRQKLADRGLTEDASQ